MHKVINTLFKENKNHLKLNESVNQRYFITLTRFILHHIYILFNKVTYQQWIGLSQREKASRVPAGLYLHYYEHTITCNNFIFYRYIDDSHSILP